VDEKGTRPRFIPRLGAITKGINKLLYQEKDRVIKMLGLLPAGARSASKQKTPDHRNGRGHQDHAETADQGGISWLKNLIKLKFADQGVGTIDLRPWPSPHALTVVRNRCVENTGGRSENRPQGEDRIPG
jgi:hypothetical protein